MTTKVANRFERDITRQLEEILYHLKLNTFKINVLGRLIGAEFKMEIINMATTQEILAKADESLVKVKANTDALSAVKQVLDDNTARIAELVEELAAANDSGATQEELAEITTKMQEVIASTDSQKQAIAALTNTSSEPNPTPVA